VNTLNYILHAIWLIIISFLLYKNSSQSNQTNVGIAEIEEQEVKRYCYINVDTLDANFKMVSDLRVEMEKQKNTYEKRFQNKVKKLQDDFVKFQNEAKYLTQEQGLAKQNELLEREQNIAGLEQELSQKLVTIEGENQEKLQEAIQFALDSINYDNQYDLIFGYNGLGNLLHANDSIEITDQVLSILNTRYTDTTTK